MDDIVDPKRAEMDQRTTLRNKLLLEEWLKTELSTGGTWIKWVIPEIMSSLFREVQAVGSPNGIQEDLYYGR